MTETITITKKEYDELKEAYEEMNMLRSHGVDNWDGYGEAMHELYNDDESEEEIYGKKIP
jgi:hypothetical protein